MPLNSSILRGFNMPDWREESDTMKTLDEMTSRKQFDGLICWAVSFKVLNSDATVHLFMDSFRDFTCFTAGTE